MGCRKCDRLGCDKIGCERLSSDGSRYICRECFEELVTRGVSTDIDDFFQTRPKRGFSEAVRAYFDAMFPVSNNV